jgi:hypothetical protein
MRRAHPLSGALLLAASCSALVQIDDDKYLGGGASLGDGAGGGLGDGDGDMVGGLGGGDGDGDTGGVGDGDGDTGGVGDGDGDEPSGGIGGAPVGGSGGGDTGGVGTGGSTGGSGAGGTPISIVEPVHYYPLDSNFDDFGSGNSLSAIGTSNVTLHPNAGLTGGSLEIPASNDEHLSLDQAVGNTDPFTISWWFIPSRDGYITLAHRIPTQQPINSWELILDQSPRLKLGGTEYHFVYAFPSMSEGVWTHIVFGYDDMETGTNDLFKVWVNGTLVLNRTLVLSTMAVVTGAGIVFGQSSGGGTEPFWGFIDEIRVYDSLLTDSQVENLYLYDAP